jgi:hypothetical protein
MSAVSTVVLTVLTSLTAVTVIFLACALVGGFNDDETN